LRINSSILIPGQWLKINSIDSLLSGFVKYPLKIRQELESNEILHIFTHHFAYLLLGLRHKESIVTCFDMIPLARSDGNSGIDKILFALCVRGMRKAKKIITISNWAKNEIVKYAGISDERIVVIPYGLDSFTFFPDVKKRERFRSSMGFSESIPVLLYVGSEQPRKNLQTITKALGLLKRTGQKFIFIKVGRPQWTGGRENFIRQIQEADLEKETKIIDYATEKSKNGQFDVTEIYNAADIFLFPSLHEGFGLPPLEAMACGVPTIASNATSIPEVVGDGAILLSPLDTRAWFDTILMLLDSSQKRKDLQNNGFRNVERFQWGRSAKILRDVYLS
jgi:glycosyltransferase involved in cell wall biosynthesis